MISSCDTCMCSCDTGIHVHVDFLHDLLIQSAMKQTP